VTRDSSHSPTWFRRWASGHPDPPDNQKYYSHEQPEQSDPEPLSQLGAQGSPASGKEGTWQSLLTGPLDK
jgi:hypothetical protein